MASLDYIHTYKYKKRGDGTVESLNELVSLIQREQGCAIKEAKIVKKYGTITNVVILDKSRDIMYNGRVIGKYRVSTGCFIDGVRREDISSIKCGTYEDAVIISNMHKHSPHYRCPINYKRNGQSYAILGHQTTCPSS